MKTTWGTVFFGPWDLAERAPQWTANADRSTAAPTGIKRLQLIGLSDFSWAGLQGSKMAGPRATRVQATTVDKSKTREGIDDLRRSLLGNRAKPHRAADPDGCRCC